MDVLMANRTEFINKLHNLDVIFSDIPCRNVLLSLLVLQGLKRFTRVISSGP